MASEFKLPELGENIESGTVTSMLIAEGDTISTDQPLLELETDKAVIELPSEFEGVVSKLHVKEGDEVKVGQVILEYEEEEKRKEKKEKREELEERKEEKREKEDAEQRGEEEEKGKEPAPGSTGAENEEKKSGPGAGGGTADVIIPELGENIESGTVSAILVSVGDSVSADQPLIELETDKAVIEMPSEVNGTVSEILISEGDTVKVGQKIMTVSGSKEAASVEQQPEPRLVEEKRKEKKEKREEREEKREERGPAAPVFEPAKSSKDIAAAAPSVRRFAREIGIDINEVPGTGPGGRISVEDIKKYSKLVNRQRSAQKSVFKGFDAEPLPDFSKWGDVDVQPMSNVRQKTATHLSYAWATIPQVTQFDKADITELEKLRKQYGKKVEAAGAKLTMTAILIKYVQAALQRFPQFNSSIDMQKKEVIYKKYYHIGVAVDTDRGLLVPVIKDVDRKNITEIAIELGELAEKARNKKLTLEQMQGGNISISNLGGIGGTAFTPIINSPEVAILGVSRGQTEPVYTDGAFTPRLMLPLSLTYDHRIIDGADGIRFLRWLIEALEQPFFLSLEG